MQEMTVLLLPLLLRKQQECSEKNRAVAKFYSIYRE